MALLFGTVGRGPFPGENPDFDQQHAETLCMLHPGGVTRPQNGYIGSLPGSNPCSYLYNRVKYRGQNATFWENIGGQNSTFRENIGVKTLHSEKI